MYRKSPVVYCAMYHGFYAGGISDDRAVNDEFPVYVFQTRCKPPEHWQAVICDLKNQPIADAPDPVHCMEMAGFRFVKQTRPWRSGKWTDHGWAMDERNTAPGQAVAR